MDNTTAAAAAAAAATAKWDSSIDRFCFSLSLSFSLYFSFSLFLFLSFSLFLLLLWPLQLSGRENIETTVKQQRCCHGMKEISTGKKSSQLILLLLLLLLLLMLLLQLLSLVLYHFHHRSNIVSTKTPSRISTKNSWNIIDAASIIQRSSINPLDPIF